MNKELEKYSIEELENALAEKKFVKDLEKSRKEWQKKHLENFDLKLSRLTTR